MWAHVLNYIRMMVWEKMINLTEISFICEQSYTGLYLVTAVAVETRVKECESVNKLSHSQYAVLIKKAQQGDTSAFAALYAATIQSQLYFATTFLKDAALAEDAVQEVYLSLYKNLSKIQDGKYFIAYLHRICYNTCVDFKKKLNKQKFELDMDVLNNQHDTNPSSNPDDRYAALEQSSEIYSALSTLPDEHRAAFLMRYYDNMKVREIAVALDCSESSVKRYINVAIEKLRIKL